MYPYKSHNNLYMKWNMFLYMICNLNHRSLDILCSMCLCILDNNPPYMRNHRIPYMSSYTALYTHSYMIVYSRRYKNLYNPRYNPCNLSLQNLSYWNRRRC